MTMTLLCCHVNIIIIGIIFFQKELNCKLHVLNETITTFKFRKGVRTEIDTVISANGCNYLHKQIQDVVIPI